MKNNIKILWIVFFVLILTSGCAQQELQPTPTDTAAPLRETSTPTNQPTETSLPGLVVLLSPAQGWGEDHTAVEQTALARGLAFEVRQGMTLAEAPPNLQVVVSFGEMPDLRDLIAGLPQVQFVVLGATGLPASPNLSALSGNGSLPFQAFMAGYIAAVQSEEWRVGIISAPGASGQTYREAFLNGVLYFCGICSPIFPPYEPYPLYAEADPSGGDAVLQQAADELIARSVDMVHVAPALQTDALYQYLAQRGVRIVGTDAPPAGLETNWVASVIAVPTMSLESVLASALDEQAVGEVPVSLQVNYTGISEARLANFAEILSKLESGEIDPVGLID